MKKLFLLILLSLPLSLMAQDDDYKVDSLDASLRYYMQAQSYYDYDDYNSALYNCDRSLDYNPKNKQAKALRDLVMTKVVKVVEFDVVDGKDIHNFEGYMTYYFYEQLNQKNSPLVSPAIKLDLKKYKTINKALSKGKKTTPNVRVEVKYNFDIKSDTSFVIKQGFLMKKDSTFERVDYKVVEKRFSIMARFSYQVFDTTSLTMQDKFVTAESDYVRYAYFDGKNEVNLYSGVYHPDDEKYDIVFRAGEQYDEMALLTKASRQFSVTEEWMVQTIAKTFIDELVLRMSRNYGWRR